MIAQKVLITIIVFGGVLIALAQFRTSRKKGGDMMAIGLLLTIPCIILMLLIEIWWG